MNNREFSGTCLCGQVTYAIDAVPRRFYFCHCEQCRRLSGTAFAANVLLEPAVVDWRSGAELVRRFDFPGERMFSRVFCIECGSPLPFLNEVGDTLIVPAGSLDVAPGIDPDINIFWADRAAWYETGVAAPHCDGFPDP